MFPGLISLPHASIPQPWAGITASSVLGNGRVDDGVRKVLTAADVTSRRAALIYYLFGVRGLPLDLPTLTTGVTSPVGSLTNLARTDLLTYTLRATNPAGTAITIPFYAWHFVPTANAKNRMVFYATGHAATFDDDKTAAPSNGGYGDWRVISSLLTAGFDVVIYTMPCYYTFGATVAANLIEPNWGDALGEPGGHGWLMDKLPSWPVVGASMRSFLTWPVVLLNQFYGAGYTNFTAAGLSGGGWTSTLWSAFDTRIYRTYAVAGSWPTYMRSDAAVGDAEQEWPGLYRYCGYLDLYLMAAHNRRFRAYLDRVDVYFGESAYDNAQGSSRISGLTWDQAVADFTGEVNTAAGAIGSGTFLMTIDETATSHQVSWQTAGAIVTDLG